MSYQAYLNNRDLQNSLQQQFGSVQTEQEQTLLEDQQTDQENKNAIGEVKEEKVEAEETGGETGILGLGTLASSDFIKSAGKKLFSNVVDSAKAQVNQAISDAKSTVTDAVNTQLEAANSAVADSIQSGRNALSGARTSLTEARTQLTSQAEGASADFSDIASTTNVAGRSFFDRLFGTNTSTVEPTGAPVESAGGMRYQNIFENEEFGEADVDLNSARSLGQSAGLYDRPISSTPGTSVSAPTPTATSELPSVSDLDELTMRGVAYTPGQELPSVTRAAVAPTTAAETETATIAENVAPKVAEVAGEGLLAGEGGEISAGIFAGLEVPGLDVVAGLAGLGSGLYDLFKHSSRAMVAPPPPPAIIAQGTQIATIQAGV